MSALLSCVLNGLVSVFPFYLCIVGGVIACALSHFPLRHPITTLRKMFAKQSDGAYSPRRAMAVALAGTLGVGNIVGVAVALCRGGVGSVFWMWVSAIVTALVKYAEIVLSTLHRRTARDGKRYGGPMYYMEDYGGKRAAKLFAALCLGSSVSGCFVQTGAVFDTLGGAVSLPKLPTATVLFLLALIIVFGGRKRLSAFSSFAVPALCVVYVLMCFAVILPHLSLIPSITASIFRSALCPRAAGGGVSAFLILCAMRQGIAKGVYSHEAGCGTAPISYAGSDTGTPVDHGILGIAEVGVDTLLLCTLTAYTVLCVFPDPQNAGLFGASLVSAAFSSVLGRFGSVLLALLCFFFAFSTLVCWAFYGTECIGYFGGTKKAVTAYRLLFCVCCLVSAYADASFVWQLCDFFTVTMTALNSAYLWKGIKEIKRETLAAFAPYKKKVKDTVKKD